jgi:CHRD domain
MLKNKSRLLGSLSFVLLAGALQADVFKFEATLSGPAESPPNTSPATGSAWVTYDDIAKTLEVSATFAGLEGITTVAHIHAPTAVAFAGAVGVATYPGTFPGFPVGVSAGSYVSPSIDLTQTASFTAGFLTLNSGTAAGAEVGLFNALMDGKAYFNLHSSRYPGGEIRGFLTPVPDNAATAPLLLSAVLGMLGFARKRFAR